MNQYFHCFEKYVCYMIWNFLLTLINSTWIIFWYEKWKVGLACPKNNVGKLYSFECLSQNIPRGQKPSLGASDNDFELSSTICSRSNMFWIKMSPKLPSVKLLLILFSNVFKLSISKSCSSSYFCYSFSLATFASSIKPCQFGFIETFASMYNGVL
jgi:hypothetical protein